MRIRKELFTFPALIVFVIVGGCSKVSERPAEAKINNSGAESAEAKKEVRIHRWHAEEVENIGAGSVGQTAEANMAPKSFYVDVVEKQMKGLSIEELIEDVGEAWASTSPYLDSMSPDWSDICSLEVYLPTNIRVLTIIEAGRRDPERVGSLVTTNLKKEIAQYPETYRLFEEFAAANPPIALFTAAGHDGSHLGNDLVIKFEQDRYAIAADMFILVNIGYSKGLDAIADFLDMLHDETEFAYTKELAEHAKKAYNVASSPAEMSRIFLCPDMTIYAMAMLLEKEDSGESFSAEKQILNFTFKDVEISKRIVVPAPGSLYSAGDFRITLRNIDTSSEPTMELEVPKSDYFINKFPQSEKDQLQRQLWEATKARRAKRGP